MNTLRQLCFKYNACTFEMLEMHSLHLYLPIIHDPKKGKHDFFKKSKYFTFLKKVKM